jgi:transposase
LLIGEAKQLHGLTYTKPLVQLFFEWVDRQLERQGFTPSNPFIQALYYVRERRVGLEIFLADPDVPIDTKHLERALAWFPWAARTGTSAGPNSAPHTSASSRCLIVTCRLHGIDPYTYLVDVLQRISEHPASRVGELTPRLWKQHFAANPLRSDLYDFPA